MLVALSLIISKAFFGGADIAVMTIFFLFAVVAEAGIAARTIACRYRAIAYVCAVLCLGVAGGLLFTKATHVRAECVAKTPSP